jgi:stage III sporulation protein AF
MIGELRNWIINICTAVIFITAVEMIMPNNSFKKYAKFVLGLILITILVNPIIKIFDRGFDMDEYTNKAIKYMDDKDYENNLSKYKDNSMSKTMGTFKLNLEKVVEDKLKEEFPSSSYNIEAAVAYDDKNESVYIKNIKVGVKDGKIAMVKKVDISTKGSVESSTQSLDDEKSRLIKAYLSKELKVSSSTIEIYKD